MCGNVQNLDELFLISMFIDRIIPFVIRLAMLCLRLLNLAGFFTVLVIDLSITS